MIAFKKAEELPPIPPYYSKMGTEGADIKNKQKRRKHNQDENLISISLWWIDILSATFFKYLMCYILPAKNDFIITKWVNNNFSQNIELFTKER